MHIKEYVIDSPQIASQIADIKLLVQQFLSFCRFRAHQLPNAAGPQHWSSQRQRQHRQHALASGDGLDLTVSYSHQADVNVSQLKDHSVVFAECFSFKLEKEEELWTRHRQLDLELILTEGDVVKQVLGREEYTLSILEYVVARDKPAILELCAEQICIVAQERIGENFVIADGVSMRSNEAREVRASMNQREEIFGIDVAEDFEEEFGRKGGKMISLWPFFGVGKTSEEGAHARAKIEEPHLAVKGCLDPVRVEHMNRSW